MKTTIFKDIKFSIQSVFQGNSKILSELILREKLTRLFLLLTFMKALIIDKTD